MKSARIDIGSIRREQVVEAAVAVIAEQGLQNLSLSEIEKKAGMSRGQLTYYFPAKEDILLAVFDRLLELMYRRVGTPEGRSCEQASAFEWIMHLVERLLARPPVSPEFSILQYTFLSQISHREDFRRRLARLYEEWRGNMAAGLADGLAKKSSRRTKKQGGARPSPSPRAVATLVQAILHGLSMQAAADPEAVDPDEMVALCRDLLGNYLGLEGKKTKKGAAAYEPAAANGMKP